MLSTVKELLIINDTGCGKPAKGKQHKRSHKMSKQEELNTYSISEHKA